MIDLRTDMLEDEEILWIEKSNRLVTVGPNYLSWRQRIFWICFFCIGLVLIIAGDFYNSENSLIGILSLGFSIVAFVSLFHLGRGVIKNYSGQVFRAHQTYAISNQRVIIEDDVDYKRSIFSGAPFTGLHRTKYDGLFTIEAFGDLACLDPEDNAGPANSINFIGIKDADLAESLLNKYHMKKSKD